MAKQTNTKPAAAPAAMGTAAAGQTPAADDAEKAKATADEKAKADAAEKAKAAEAEKAKASEKPEGKVVKIRAFVDGFRRCGMGHSSEEKTHPAGTFNEDQIKILLAEPKLMVVVLDE